MLPDYLLLKEKIHSLHLKRMKSRVNALTHPFDEVKPHRMFEGDSSAIIREDGSEDKIDIQRISAEMTLSMKDGDPSDPSKIFQQIDMAAENFARQKSQMMFRSIEEAVNKVGNVVDSKDQPFSPEHFFAMLEKVMIEFTEEGKPILPTIVAGNKAGDALSREFREMEASDVFKKRFDDLMEMKRVQWLDREANRQLVG